MDAVEKENRVALGKNSLIGGGGMNAQCDAQTKVSGQKAWEKHASAERKNDRRAIPKQYAIRWVRRTWSRVGEKIKILERKILRIEKLSKINPKMLLFLNVLDVFS